MTMGKVIPMTYACYSDEGTGSALLYCSIESERLDGRK
jgi:hypothetical protein